jgi:Na+/H+-dicarboxylate symporter
MTIKNNMLTWILISMALGIFCGIEFPSQMIAMQWIGQLFINLLKLIVLPLIFSALVSAITSIGGMQRLSSIGVFTLGYVLISVSIAVTIGLVLLNVFQPGIGIPPSLILANATPSDIQPMPLSRYLLSLFPPNIVAAAAKYEIMPIVFFSIVFSLAALSVGASAKPVINFFVGLRNILIKMILWLMYLTPIGLFSLLGAAVAEASIEHLLLQSLAGMIAFILVFMAGLVLQISWQITLATILTKTSPREFFASASNALITAFATSSSMATLPVTMLVAKEQKVSDDVARFVLPLATTINLAGTAMYEAVSALFFCQILGYHLSLLSQIGVFITAILAGMGATGIPEGGLITMVMVLRNVNVPTSAIGLLLPFDRILDRFRTMTNVCGDLVCAITVDYLQKRHEKHASRVKTVRAKRSK